MNFKSLKPTFRIKAVGRIGIKPGRETAPLQSQRILRRMRSFQRLGLYERQDGRPATWEQPCWLLRVLLDRTPRKTLDGTTRESILAFVMGRNWSVVESDL